MCVFLNPNLKTDRNIQIIIFKEGFDLKPISRKGAKAPSDFARRVRLKMPPFLNLNNQLHEEISKYQIHPIKHSIIWK